MSNPKTNYRDGDAYTRMAKKAGYRSRASLKLKEILKKDISIKKGMSIIDLGSFPGGWTQVVKESVGNKGTVAAVDIQDMKEIKGTFFIHKSIAELEDDDFEEFREKVPFDLVLSDMAPNISGIRETDDAQMIYLVENVLSVIDKFLKKGGSALIKVFQGESLDYTRNALS
ncbi:MAG TPA: RlmE family RNA methyltransferase, partial [SAR86 cluster bacterium]|nr:RlmE family RNA methyltransferase [SAR86 cluster bacterium]